MRQLNVRDPWAGLAYQDEEKAVVDDLTARIQALEARVLELEAAIKEVEQEPEPVGA